MFYIPKKKVIISKFSYFDNLYYVRDVSIKKTLTDQIQNCDVLSKAIINFMIHFDSKSRVTFLDAVSKS